MKNFLAALLAVAAPVAASAQAAADFASLNRLFDGSRSRAPGAAAVAVPAAARPALSAEESGALDALFAAVPAASRAWPGYNLFDRPFLAVLKDGSAILIGHPNPPANFRAVPYRGRLVFVADAGPEIGFSYKIDYELGGAKVMAVSAQGKSSLEDLMRLAVHERFHDYQHGRRFLRDYQDYRVEEAQDVALASSENAALSRWVRAGDPDAMRDFAALRSRRRALFPGTAAEGVQENLEGTARFVELEAYAAMKGAAASKDDLLKNLAGSSGIDAMPKGRLYPVGAALGLFLETRAPGAWQADVENGRRVSDIVLDRLALDRAEVDARVRRLTASPDYAAALARARRGVTALRDRRRDALLRFDAQPGLRVLLKPEPGSESSEYFSSQGWLDYPDGTTLFDPVDQYVGPGFELKGIMLRKTDDGFEFFLAPGARIEADGAPWTPVPGRRSFNRLRVAGAGVSIAGGRGSFDDDGRVLTVALDRAAP